MKKTILILFFSLLLAACSKEATIELTEEATAQMPVSLESPPPSETIVMTPDEKMTFKLINEGEFDNSTIEYVKNRLLLTYEYLKDEAFKTNYSPANNVWVYLRKGDESSWGMSNYILLYKNETTNFPVSHELSHTYLGYGLSFDGQFGFFTQEGMAVYIGDKLGDNMYNERTINPHYSLLLLLEKGKTIPLRNLINLDSAPTYFRLVNLQPTKENFALQYLSYDLAGSFSDFFISTYGMENYGKLYNQRYLEEKIKEVTGKTIEDIELVWHNYVINNVPPISDELRSKSLYSTLSERIELIDSTLFEVK